jgi:hypothetical protein
MNIWKTLAVYQAVEELSLQYSEAMIITEDLLNYVYTVVSSRATDKLEKMYKGLEMFDIEVWDIFGELISQDVITIGTNEVHYFYIQIINPLPVER